MIDRQLTVYGAGPSGLMAAWAAYRAGWYVKLYDPAPKEPDGRSAGVFYLHDACDLEIGPPTTVHTQTRGTREGYAQKLYNDESATTSWPDESYTQDVWDGMRAMRALWEVLKGDIEVGSLKSFKELMYIEDGPPVISTAPLDQLLGIPLPHRRATIMTGHCSERAGASVTYDGYEYTPIYRTSNIYGRVTIEYIPGYDPSINEIANHPPAYHHHTVRKVEPTFIGEVAQAALPHDVLLAGRYGRWDKSCLTHDVYYNVTAWLKRLEDRL